MPIRQNAHHKYFFKKSLGQNILVDGNTIRKIISLLDAGRDDVILEIGPGLGALTDELARMPNDIIAIEKDRRFTEMLNQKHVRPNIRIINADALRYDYEELYDSYKRKIKVVGNLPYNISTEVVFRLFGINGLFKSFLFMFQKEVAKRIVASPSTKDYGILGVISQYYSRPAMLMTVPADCFTPKPKVESAVVYFDIYDRKPFQARDEKLFKAVVKTAFSKRRKMLGNCFRGFGYNNASDSEISEAFTDAGIDTERRGETLSVGEFVRLSDAIYEKSGAKVA